MQRVVHTSFVFRGFLGLQSGSDTANTLHSFQTADSTRRKGGIHSRRPQNLSLYLALTVCNSTPPQKGEARLGSAVGGVAPPRLFQGGSFQTRQQKQALRRRGIICYYYWR